MPNININADNFISGESTSNFLANGGFSSNSYGLNLTKERGRLYFAETPTDRGGATLTGNIIADAFDGFLSGNDNYFLDDEGNFYTLNGSTFTNRQTVVGSSADSLSWTLGTSEILQFTTGKNSADHFLFSTAEYSSGNGAEIVRMTGSNLNSTDVDSQWWTVTQGQNSMLASVRHPLEIVEGTLYIGDGDRIHTWDGTSSVASAIALPPDVNITTLRKHPDGVNLIAFCGVGLDYSHTSGAGGRIYLIDTITKTYIREITTEEQVEGSRNVGGIIYVTFGDKIGYFDGNGIKKLKDLNTSTTTYSHNMTNMEDILMVRDGLDVLAFGDLGKGKVWWRPYHNSTNQNNINNIAYKGDNKLLVAFSDGAGAGKLQEIDYDNAGVSGRFVTNRYLFPEQVTIKGLDFIHTITDSANTSQFDVYSVGDITTSIVESISYASMSAVRTPIRYSEIVDTAQYQLQPVMDDLGFKIIRILYE